MLLPSYRINRCTSEDPVQKEFAFKVGPEQGGTEQQATEQQYAQRERESCERQVSLSVVKQIGTHYL